jgi:deazaflavin-dependent oxidoreductase (nitroreductase family)
VNIKDEVGKVINTIHRNLFERSGGKVGGNLLKMPVVKLTTTGRKTGQPRETMLTSPLVEGDTVILVASWGGDDRHPVWYLNLVANPEVSILMGGKERAMTARVAAGAERTDLWTRLTAAHDNYAGYQTKTDREIPVIVLEPR